MSTGLGYFQIEFYNADGEPDADAAKRAYEWCVENYSWFDSDDGTPFVLKDNAIKPNYDDYPDGLDIKHSDIPGDIMWLERPFREAKATRLVASVWQDFTDGIGGPDANSYEEGVWEKGKHFNNYVVNSFVYTSNGYSYYEGKILSEWRYREQKALFKNKKTGQEILAGDFNTDTPDFDGNYDIDDSDGADEIVIEYIIGEKAFNTEWWPSELIKYKNDPEFVKAFVDLLKNVEGYADTREEDWEFVEVTEQRNFFDLYGSKSPQKDYDLLDEDGLHKGRTVSTTKSKK